MFGKLLAIIDGIRSSLWFWPVSLSIGAIGLAWGTISLDRSGLLDDLSGIWLYASGLDSARTLLATIATSAVSIAATIFSITIVALSLAAGQMGPRLLRTFVRDRSTQVSLGTFIATFVYCVYILSVIDASEGEQFLPRAAVSAALALGLASVSVLIYFIHHVAWAIQVPNVISVVGRELDESIEAMYAGKLVAESREIEAEAAQDRIDNASPVLAARTGYIQRIDMNALFGIAVEFNTLIRVSRAPGAHVLSGVEVASVPRNADNAAGGKGELAQKISGAFVLGPARSPMQDPLFVVNQLVEIAQRALSPGVNDPSTAEACVDRLGGALVLLLRRPDPRRVHRDEHGHARLITMRPGFADFLQAAFDPIRDCSRTSRQVSARLAGLLADLAPFATTKTRRNALHAQIRMLARAAEDLPEPGDRQTIQVPFQRAIRALAVTGD